MPRDVETRPGILGLNLGVDPEDAPPGSLTEGDGFRILESGAVHSRAGRVRAGLDFPNEGVIQVPLYIDSIDHFKTMSRCRGLGVFYDQRCEMRAATTGLVTMTIPQRMNFLTKSQGKFYFNDVKAVPWGVDPTVILYGDGGFASQDTRAKFVVHGDRVYIIDESTEPKVFQRRPLMEQLQYSQVRYDVRRMGIVWPTKDTHKVTATWGAGGVTALPAGSYKVRIILENKNGSQSNPSMVTECIVTAAQSLIAGFLTINWNATTLEFPTGPNDVKAVRVYVAFVGASTAQIEPSDFYYLRLVEDVSGDGTTTFTYNDYAMAQSKPLMPLSNGAPPRLLDMIIINGVSVAIPMPDTIYREVVESYIESGTREIVEWWYDAEGNKRERKRNIPITKLVFKTTVKPLLVDSSMVMWGDPGEPEYLENRLRVARGNEICVGLAPIGKECVVFTNNGIKIFDPISVSVRDVPSKVGCMSRDSIIETDRGIFFMGSDGIPRIFNGATFEVEAVEVMPIFSRPDYIGAYSPYDRTSPKEISGTYGKSRLYVTYPTTAVSPNLLIGDSSRGNLLWGIDRLNYEFLSWIGREGRLLGVDTEGWFYFIEEGLTDEVGPILEYPGPVLTRTVYPINFAIAMRKPLPVGLGIGDVFKLAVDLDTKGETVTMSCSIPNVDGAVIEYILRTAHRQTVRQYLPANFWGQSMAIRFTATPAQRIAIYGIAIESDSREVF